MSDPLPLSSNTLDAVPIPGGGLLAYDTSDPYWSKRVTKLGGDEPEIWFVLKELVNETTLFIDGGANIGLYSAAAAQRISDPAQILAVEPDSHNRAILEHTRALNGGSFTIVPEAIWNQAGETLSFQECKEGVSSTLKYRQDKPSRAVREVHTTTIDQLTRNARAKAPWIENVIVKLDVEKAEEEALAGAAETLREMNTLLIYEDHRTMDVASKATAAYLARGLHIYHVNEQGELRTVQSVEEAVGIKQPPRKGYDFLACVPGSKFDQELSRRCEQACSVTKKFGELGEGEAYLLGV